MLYKFLIDLSDVDRGIYQTLDFRTALHPSEIPSYLLSRVIAYALQYADGLEFSAAGLGDPDAPALLQKSLNGAIENWIEIGNASVKKLHKAGKASKNVVVYTYKNAEVLIAEIKNSDVHRADEIQIYQIDQKLLTQLEKHLEKSNRWTLLHQGGHLDISDGTNFWSGTIQKFPLNLY